jgi:hypothetical protein
MHKFCHFPEHFIMKFGESVIKEHMLKKRHENELFGQADATS